MPQDTLDDVIVTGQRRPKGASSGFPSLPSYIWIPAPFTTPEVQKGDPIQVVPCDVGTVQYAWNSDAAAVEAAGQVLAEAAAQGDVGDFGPELAQREYGVVGTRAPRRGIIVGPTSVGPTMSEATPENPFPSVRFNYDGVTPYNIVFLHHTHTGGGYNVQPSGADIQIFNDWVQQMIAVGRSPSELTMYITAQEFNDGVLTTSTYAWKHGDMTEEAAQEVNPNADRCPD